MSSWKEGDRVRIKSRPVTPDDQKSNRYFAHMAGLTGVIENVYTDETVAVKIDLESVTKASFEVHEQSEIRMRNRFLAETSEEAKKMLTKEELEFPAHFMHLVQVADLEKES